MSSSAERPSSLAKSNSRSGWWLLLGAVSLYAAVFFFNPALVKASLNHFVGLLKTIAPILVLVMLFMWVLDVLVSPQRIRKMLGHEAGWRGWAISIVGGILSHGPVYAWYPLLENLQKEGVRPAFIAAFLYARSIKLPWLPLLAFYFGVTYMIVLTVLLVVFSPVAGWLTERSCGKGC